MHAWLTIWPVAITLMLGVTRMFSPWVGSTKQSGAIIGWFWSSHSRIGMWYCIPCILSTPRQHPAARVAVPTQHTKRSKRAVQEPTRPPQLHGALEEATTGGHEKTYVQRIVPFKLSLICCRPSFDAAHNGGVQKSAMV